ncbi:MAG: alpha/beta hydrolase [candidate division KSB1 bacterium]|jgi:fermentation-respiration switch protein FrsA (DUF1100 family)|nr:alpha/beta hydrolase [candidate division KSB1 bacterium]
MMKIRIIAILMISALTIASCTTVELTERDAFDIKRTIRPDYFQNTPYSIEEVLFDADDSLRLNGWHMTRDGSRGTVLYFGGNGFVMVSSYHIIKAFLDQNVDLFVFDYRGYGENPGAPTVSGLKEDGLAAYDYLINEKRVDPEELVIHGHSLGTFVAAYVATQREASGLVLECPITDAQDWTGRLVPWFLKPFINFDIDPALKENSNLVRVSSVDIPLLVFAGGQDKVTPPGMAETIYETAGSASKRIVVIEDGGHNDLPNRKEYADALNAFYDMLDGFTR